MVRRRVGIWLSEFQTTFPMKGSCRLAIWCRIDGMRYKRIQMDSFVMCSSMTCVIDIPSILRILRWKNTSNFLSNVSRSAQLSHPHSSELTGMAQKIRYLKCWQKVMMPPSGRTMGCVSYIFSYHLSSRERLLFLLSCFGFVVSGKEEEEASEGGQGNSLKNPGAGNKMASVFDALVALPTCISRPNLANCRQMTAEPSSIYFREGKANAPSSTYNMQNMSKRVPP